MTGRIWPRVVSEDHSLSQGGEVALPDLNSRAMYSTRLKNINTPDPLTQQRRELVVAKIFFGGAYLLLPLILSSGGTSSDSGSAYWLARDILDVLVPPALVIYSCALYIYFSVDKRLL